MAENGKGNTAAHSQQLQLATDGPTGTSCPYLDTIQRSVLDFDFEVTCSITLESGPHIYACLVCGKYFRGRGPQTPAYIHAVNESHYMFCHLRNGTFHCLPDGYQVRDASLDDIRNALHPSYTETDIAQINTNTELSRDMFGRLYLPGFVGLNNPNKTDCINAVVQALAHVPPIRDYFLRQRTENDPSTSMVNTSAATKGSHVSPLQAVQVTKCFGELIRKIWSHQRLKSHVDPHKLVNAVASASKNKFKIGHEQIEVGSFMAWFLHQLHVGTGGAATTTSSSNVHRKKKKQKLIIATAASTSIIEQVFQGKVRVTTRQAKRHPTKKRSSDDLDDRAGSDTEPEFDGNNHTDATKNDDDDGDDICVEETEMDTTFLQLTLDISEKPLFRDEDGGLVIPQEPLVTVLQKFDGMTFSDAIHRGTVQRRKYNLQVLPPYLILNLARFTLNQYSRVKNPTIVAFPVTNLDLSRYVEPVRNHTPLPTEEEIRNMTSKELKDILIQHGHQSLADRAIEKSELMETALDFVVRSLPDLLRYKYDLVANIIHESPADVGREGKYDPLAEGSYKCHVQNRGTRQWYEIQDLHVQEIMPQQIGISESCLLIFERQQSSPAIGSGAHIRQAGDR